MRDQFSYCNHPHFMTGQSLSHGKAIADCRKNISFRLKFSNTVLISLWKIPAGRANFSLFTLLHALHCSVAIHSARRAAKKMCERQKTNELSSKARRERNKRFLITAAEILSSTLDSSAFRCFCLCLVPLRRLSRRNLKHLFRILMSYHRPRGASILPRDD